jgi:hypothetical protein
MSGIMPVQSVITTTKDFDAVRRHISSVVQSRRGSIVEFDERRVVCDFGSLKKSRLVGEFWVSKETLPARATILMRPGPNGGTQVKVEVVDTHKLGLKAGFVRKYEEALKDISNLLVFGMC